MKPPERVLAYSVIGVLVVAVFALAVLFFKKGNTGPIDTKPQLIEVKSGETVTKSKIEEQRHQPNVPKQVDTGRLQSTYEVGKTYVNTVKATVDSRGSMKDWGVKTAGTFNYGAEFQISRFVRSNDGTRMEAEVKIDRACSLSIFTEIEGIKLEMPAAFQGLIEVGAGWAGLPIGTSEVAAEAAEQLLNLEVCREYLSKIANDSNAKLFASVDEMQNKRARIVFENGKGVTSITPVNCTLSSDEQLFFADLSMIADVTMMESLDCKPGSKWEVVGKDFIGVLDPSMKSKIGGSVMIVRKEDIQTAGSPEARLEISGGLLKFADRYENDGSEMHSNGSWAPKGQAIFSFGQKIITEAEMSGIIELVENSVDHILFEMKNEVRPVFEIKYSAWIAEGDQLDDPKELQPPKRLGTLDSLRSRLPK